MSRIEKLILEYPSAPWDWNALSSNPAVSFAFIKDHPELLWNPNYVSRNRSITEQDVRNNPDFGWDYELLCGNPNISFAFMNEYIIKPDAVKRINWQLISSNPAVSLFDILNNQTYQWDHQYLSANTNITSNFILNEGRDYNWYRPFVCSNKGLTAKDIFKSTLKSLFEWDYKNLSSNPNLPIVYVKDNLDNDWNFHEISSNAGLVDVEQYHQIPWDYHGLSMNRNTTMNYVNRNKHRAWHIPSLLSNSSLHFNSFDYEWIRTKYIDPVQTYLCSNATITSAWVKKNKSYIDWKRLSSNVLS